MKGMMTVLIVLVVALIFGGLYWYFGKQSLDKQVKDRQAEVDANTKTLKDYDDHKALIPQYEAQLPRWQRQFEIFRAAIPVQLEDDVFLRNLDEQLRANNVKLLSVELTPGGAWMPTLNDTQEKNYEKENMNPDEIRSVKVANFSIGLSGNFGDVLRAFENLKLYGRIFSINQIISPAGGAGGAVFQNESAATTPIQVTGKVFYGLSEKYLSQETLDTYFGRAETMKAAAEVSGSDMARASQLSDNPASAPTAPPPSSSAGAAGSGAGGAKPTGVDVVPGAPTRATPPAGGAAPKAAPGAPTGAGSASAGPGQASRLAKANKSHNHAIAVGG